MKVLFLDVDGVLNHAAWMETRKDGRLSAGEDFGWWASMLDPRAVTLLNSVLDRTGAKVVVSSTWRLQHGLASLQKLLESAGFTGEVISRTPSHDEGGRGAEIFQWLDFHPEVEAYAIVDDSDDVYPLGSRLVQTSWECGLQENHADALVAMLEVTSDSV